MREVPAPETTYTVSGTVDAHVTGVKLVGNTNHEEVTGVIDGTSVTFSNVKADTYTIVATYESGYTDKSGESRTIEVNGNITNLAVTSQASSTPEDFSAVIVDGDTALNSIMAGNTTQVTVNIINPKSETKTMMLFCAVYDSNNVLRAVTSTTKEVSAATDTMTATLEMPDAQTLPRDEIASAKIFVWDSGLVPYAWAENGSN